MIGSIFSALALDGNVWISAARRSLIEVQGVGMVAQCYTDSDNRARHQQ